MMCLNAVAASQAKYLQRTMSRRAISITPESDLAMWRAEVEALPLRKREKWHTTVDDRCGVMRRVRYMNGEFQMKTHSDGSGATADWIPVMSFETSLQKYGCPKDMDAEYKRALAAYCLRGDDGLSLEICNIANEAATGNQYSNPKKVKVPTQPGQPVRG